MQLSLCRPLCWAIVFLTLPIVCQAESHGIDETAVMKDDVIVGSATVPNVQRLLAPGGGGGSSQEARLGEDAQLSSRLQAQAFAKKLSSEGLAQVKDFIRQEVKARMVKARTVKAHKNNCRTVCTAKCAKEHNKEGGKKYPICDLPYSVTSYLSPEKTIANSDYVARRRRAQKFKTTRGLQGPERCASAKRDKEIHSHRRRVDRRSLTSCTSCYEDNRCHETEETGIPNNQLGEWASTKPLAADGEAGVRGRRRRGRRRFQRRHFQRRHFQRRRFQRRRFQRRRFQTSSASWRDRMRARWRDRMRARWRDRMRSRRRRKSGARLIRRRTQSQRRRRRAAAVVSAAGVATAASTRRPTRRRTLKRATTTSTKTKEECNVSNYVVDEIKCRVPPKKCVRKERFVFFPSDTVNKVGTCAGVDDGQNTGKMTVRCAVLDKPSCPVHKAAEWRCNATHEGYVSDPSAKNQICTKYGIVEEDFSVSMMDKQHAGYKHFAKYQETTAGNMIGRCELIKYTACRDGDCVVKKHVTCVEVCKWYGRDQTKYAGSNTKVLTHCRKDLCQGKQAWLACAHVAMMA